MIKINDYATKNHLNEWEIKELPESEVYRLDLQDFSIIFALPKFDKPIKLFIPTPTKPTIAFSLKAIFASIYHNVNHGIQIFFIDVNNVNTMGQYKNITPDWSKYIAKDNAVLFLSGENANRYSNISYENFTKIIYENDTFSMQDDSLGYVKNDNVLEWNKKISIIASSIHSQNIQEISNIAKDLKENYGVEYVEVIPPHCYIKIFQCANNRYYNNKKIEDGLDGKLITEECSIEYIDKITTTDSTGVLKVQDTEHLQVINCKEFFNL